MIDRQNSYIIVLTIAVFGTGAETILVSAPEQSKPTSTCHPPTVIAFAWRRVITTRASNS
jgi:hypothetical protein